MQCSMITTSSSCLTRSQTNKERSFEPTVVTLYAVDNSGLQAGDTVLIAEAGPFGALTVLSVDALGASQIFVAEPNPGRRRFIESRGLCAGVVDLITEDVPARGERTAANDVWL
jgi:(R,R)-butanediol dehydrogenase/meso-butanediol dehydrogenase/diacetyl reductase